MLCQSNVILAEDEPIRVPEGWQIKEQRTAFFVLQARDLWYRKATPERP